MTVGTLQQQLATIPDLSARLAAIPDTPTLRFIPIRHHSPAVAQHIKRLFTADQPELVLIEAPENLQAVLPYLADAETRPPVAVYCYHQHPDDPSARARAYYPMARFSPEWVALKLACDAGAQVRFIDAPYLQRSSFRSDDSGAEDRSLLDENDWRDHHLLPQLLQTTACRDIDELWDRWFESRAHHTDSHSFFQDLKAWCLLLRPDPAQADAETALREQCMAAHIRDAVDSGKRVWVVTGGYHTEALAQSYAQAAPRAIHSSELSKPDAQHGVALIPYSLQRLDKANQYAAGLPDCGYYHALWNKQGESAEKTNTELTLKVAQYLREAGELISLPDCIEAMAQRQRLAALRGVQAGRMEWRDGLHSCFQAIHGDHEQLLDQAIQATLQEERTGRVCRAWPLLPMVDDFRRSARQWRLPLSAATPAEKSLDIYRSQRHRDISAWLHRLRFLGSTYGDYTAGPNFAEQKDLNRVREIWTVQWQPDVEAHLTEQQHLGTHIAEAAANRLLAQLSDPEFQGTIASLLPQALRMGLNELISPCLAALETWLGGNHLFESLVEALAQLLYCQQLQKVLRLTHFPSLQSQQQLAYRNACSALGWIQQVDTQRSAAIQSAIRQLSAFIQQDQIALEADLFLDQLHALLQQNDGTLAGLACGVLYHHGALSDEAVDTELNNACRQAWIEPNYIGDYLTGLMQSSRAIVLNHPKLLSAISQLIEHWDESTFLQCLPGLRLAFTQLKPRESQRLGQQIQALLNGEPDQTPTQLAPLKRDELRQAHALLKQWGW
jgi:hypothetical protein